MDVERISRENFQEWWLTNKRGLRMYARVWLPEEASRANLILVHGLGEHSGRYDHVARFFTAKGVAVFAQDLQGHGHSDGKRGYVKNFADYLDDLELFRSLVLEFSPNKPIFLYGHSMGGSIVLLYLLDYQRYIAAGIVSAPSIGIKMGPPTFFKELVPRMAQVIPALTVDSGLKPAWLSHDEEVVSAYKADPFTHSHISLSLFSGMYEGGKHILAHAAEIAIPIFMLYGSKDEIIRIEDVEAAFEKMKSRDKKKKVFQNDFHEVHNEADQREAFDAIWEWLEPKC